MGGVVETSGEIRAAFGEARGLLRDPESHSDFFHFRRLRVSFPLAPLRAFDVHDTSRSIVMPTLESASAASSSAAGAVAHPHDTTISTCMVDDCALPADQRRPVDLAKLKQWLTELLWQDGVYEKEGQATTTSRLTTTPPAAGDKAPPAATASLTAPAAAASPVGSSSTNSAGVALAPAPSSTRANQIFRLKAIMSTTGESGPTFLQGVQQLYDLQHEGDWPATKDGKAPEKFTRFVFIGRRLEPAVLRAGYQSIFV